MAFLENEIIIAPKLYATCTDQATLYKNAVDIVVNERDILFQNKTIAEARSGVIINELAVLKRQLSRSLVIEDRNTIKTSITALEIEKEMIWDVMGIDVDGVLEDRITGLEISVLEDAAKIERDMWFTEINTYEHTLSAAYNKSLLEIRTIRAINIYDSSYTNFENLKRSIGRN